MLKRFGGVLFVLFLLVGCGQANSSGHLEKVGLLLPETIDDQVWGINAYKGMLKIQSTYEIDVHCKEGMDSYLKVSEAMKEFDQNGINLVFVHGSEFSLYFNELALQYPHIHFVSVNGDAKLPNTTSLNFEGYAMGFFGGMVAAHQTRSNEVAVIAAFEWQPEVEGFYEGAKFENDLTEVHIEYVGHWDDEKGALEILQNLTDKGVDVVYPAGDNFNVPVISTLREKGLFAIGYVSDQSVLGKSTVLVSTMQHVDLLYHQIAKQFDEGQLVDGNISFDFQDEVISMGKFSPLIDEDYRKEIFKYIHEYKQTGKLPNE